MIFNNSISLKWSVLAQNQYFALAVTYRHCNLITTLLKYIILNPRIISLNLLSFKSIVTVAYLRFDLGDIIDFGNLSLVSFWNFGQDQLENQFSLSNRCSRYGIYIKGTHLIYTSICLYCIYMRKCQFSIEYSIYINLST